MDPNTPADQALALGKLIGTVGGLVDSIKDQNLTAERNRTEFMKIFEGIREDSKENNKILTEHLKDDQLHHAALLEVMMWKKNNEEKLENLWDTKNKQTGVMVALTTIGTIVGGGVVGLIEWLTKK